VLDESAVAAHVRSGWGLAVTAARLLPAGLDPHARAYQVTTASGDRYFVKVRAVAARDAAVLVPRYLRRHGITAVVAPLDTSGGQPWLRADGHQLLVYPFIDGANAWDTGFTDEQWLEYSGFLAALHDTALPADLAARVDREVFDPPSIGQLHALRIEDGGDSPSQRELRVFWRAHAGQIDALAMRVTELRMEAARQPTYVLCHADIHTGNVVIDATGHLSIVDWDAPVFAPRERDLMFALGGPWSARPVTRRQEALFWRGYGTVDVDPPTLAYYLCERVVDDIVQFAQRILADDVSEQTRRGDLSWLTGSFAPGDVVDRARSCDPPPDLQ
jgi:spectinomycin phosphotransferase